MLLQTSLLICFLIKIFAQNPCQIKTFNSSENIACVCNSTYCDDFPQLPQLNADQAAVYVSSKSGKRFELSNLSFVSDASSDQNVIKIQVDPSQTYQSILGFGGAFTGATTYNIWVLRNTSNQISENLLKSYFGDGGIDHTCTMG
uniref:Glucosylceramidase n=1 Tax=Acrobeloides nanus TaxID=290746 RepID=A0A914DVY5_9BILA